MKVNFIVKHQKLVILKSGKSQEKVVVAAKMTQFGAKLAKDMNGLKVIEIKASKL